MKVTRTIFGAGLIAFLSSNAGNANEKCEPFTLRSHGAESSVVEFVDSDPKGVSIGDRRIGKNNLHDAASGEQVGEARWILTVIQPGKDGQLLVSTQEAFVFPEGTILYSAVPETASSDVSDIVQTGVAFSSERIITAGSGVFLGAIGTIDFSKHPDGGTLFKVNIGCVTP